MRVVLIGGTSNTGKSTVAAQVARRLGCPCVSTDSLGRHPGRPWRTAEREVPPHVAAHYRTHSVAELLDSVLAHYARVWPRVLELVEAAASGGPGLVLEGSALWPDRVAGLMTGPGVLATWLSAPEPVLRTRIHADGGYPGASAAERHLMDRFLARTVAFQDAMLASCHHLGLPTVPVAEHSPASLATHLLGAGSRDRHLYDRGL